jgi:hypothetical protein
MIDYAGSIYYIDLDEFDRIISYNPTSGSDKFVTSEKKITRNEKNEVVSIEEFESQNTKGKEIDGPKYEVMRMMLEIIMDEKNEDVDTSLGIDRALQKTPLSYRIAFNTLLHYGVIKEIND